MVLLYSIDFTNEQCHPHFFSSKRNKPDIPPPPPISHVAVRSVQDLRTEGPLLDLRLGRYSFQGLMIVIATGFILSHRSPLFRRCLYGKAASG